MKRIIFLVLLLVSQPGCGASGAGNGAPDPVQDVNEVQAKELISSRRDIVIIDVRTPDEYNAGHIPGAVLLNVSDPSFATLVGKLERTRTYLVYCRSGNRSRQAAVLLVEMGYASVYDFGGIQDWPYEVVQ